MKARSSAGIVRLVMVTLMPLAAFVLQSAFWAVIQPFAWFLFFPAVFFSSWIGGLFGGIIATIISTAMAWWFFIPPENSFALEDPFTLGSIILFVVMGVLFGYSQERVRKARRQAAEALAAERTANDKLSGANERITQLYEKTRDIDRLKTEFFANVSHELRTPLALILGPLARRLSADDPGEEARRDLEMIDRNARLMNRHVNDLLDVARLEAGRMEMSYTRTDLAAVSRFVASHFESLAGEKHIGFTVDVPDALGAEADAEKYRRILLNLLSNAFKFTPSDGAVSLSLESIDGNAVLKVEDNGPGVPAEMRTAVFERFRQVDGGAGRRFGGTGLGLAIASEFSELHGGSVQVMESPGGGALFVVVLPLKAPMGVEIHTGEDASRDVMDTQAVDELRMRQSASGPAAGPDAPLVLIVEDNPDMVTFLAEVLGSRYRVVSAFNGEEGLRRALETRPDLIISDIMMPRMSGDRMVEELRRRNEMEDVPIIMLTARADDELRVKLLKGGVQDYLNKPFSVDELLARADRLVSERKISADRLHESRNILQSFYDSSPLMMGVAELDGDDIVALSGNAAVAEFFGVTPDALSSRTGDDLGAPAEVNRLWLGYYRRSQSEGRAVRFEYPHPVSSGERWLAATVSFLGMSPSGRPRFSFVAEDSTERKTAEKSMQASFRFLETVHRHTEVALLIREFVSVIKDYTGCDSAGIRVLNDEGTIPYQAYEGFSTKFFEMESPLSIHTDRCMCINVIKGAVDPALPFYTKGGSFYMNGTTRFLATVSDREKGETRNVCNMEGYESVALVPFRSAGEILGLIHVADHRENMVPLETVGLLERAAMQLGTVFQRASAEEALRKSEARYRNLFESMLEGYAYCRMVFDDGTPGDFQYIDVNRAFGELTGLQNVAGKMVSDVIPGIRESNPELFEIYGRVARSGAPEKFETFIESMGIWFAVSVFSPVREYFVAVFDNITPRKNAEREIRLLNTELENRVAERTTQLNMANKELESFSYSVSHDLRAPLRHIGGFVGMLREHLAQSLDETGLHYMDVIFRSAEKMGNLIDDLLSFSRMGRAGMMSTGVNMTALVSDVLKGFEDDILKRSVAVHIDPLPVIQGDPAMLRVVLSNLISNALKFTGNREKAEIWISCGEEERNSPSASGITAPVSI